MKCLMTKTAIRNLKCTVAYVIMQKTPQNYVHYPNEPHSVLMAEVVGRYIHTPMSSLVLHIHVYIQIHKNVLYVMKSTRRDTINISTTNTR